MDTSLVLFKISDGHKTLFGLKLLDNGGIAVDAGTPAQVLKALNDENDKQSKRGMSVEMVLMLGEVNPRVIPGVTSLSDVQELETRGLVKNLKEVRTFSHRGIASAYGNYLLCDGDKAEAEWQAGLETRPWHTQEEEMAIRAKEDY